MLEFQNFMQKYLREKNARPANQKEVITPCKDTHMDWPKFWSQIPNITKFLYLGKMVMPKVGLLMDGSLFNSKGYGNN